MLYCHGEGATRGIGRRAALAAQGKTNTQAEAMKIGIYGAGAIGGYLADRKTGEENRGQ